MSLSEEAERGGVLAVAVPLLADEAVLGVLEVRRTEGLPFSGAEIEQVVLSALYAAFAEERDIDDQKILAEIAATSPLSQLMPERLAELRAWGRGRCVLAD